MPGKPRSMNPGRSERVEELKSLINNEDYLKKAIESIAGATAEGLVRLERRDYERSSN